LAGVDVDAGQVLLTGSGLDASEARERIERLGYQVGEQSQRPAWSPLAVGLAALLVVLVGSLLFQLGSDALFASGGLASLSESMRGAGLIGLPLAFALGLLVAFAPPTYAMAPAVMGYVTGAGANSRKRALRLSVAFVAGIVLVDVALGAAFALAGTQAIGFISSRLVVWYLVAAVVLLAMAAVNLRLWRPRLPGRTPRLRQSGTTGGAFMVGVRFGLMACPGCTPLLLPVALGAATAGSVLYGAALMGAFALGRGIPLAVLGTFTGVFERMLSATRLVRRVEVAVGVLLLVAAAWFVSQFIRVGGFSALFG
jgi:cytochrome c-type biogenesis protein